MDITKLFRRLVHRLDVMLLFLIPCLLMFFKEKKNSLLIENGLVNHILMTTKMFVGVHSKVVIIVLSIKIQENQMFSADAEIHSALSVDMSLTGLVGAMLLTNGEKKILVRVKISNGF